MRVLIKPNLYEYDVKLVKFIRRPAKVDLRNTVVRTGNWLLSMRTSKKGNLFSDSFSTLNRIYRMLVQLDTIAIRKRLLRSAASKRSREHRKLTIAKEKLIGWLKERLNGLDFYILQQSLCGTIKENTRKLASVWKETTKSHPQHCASFLGWWRGYEFVRVLAYWWGTRYPEIWSFTLHIPTESQQKRCIRRLSRYTI